MARTDVKGGYADTYTELPGMGIHALGPNALVVVQGEQWTLEAATALRDALRQDVIVVGLNDGDTLEVLDEAMMREHGWVRAE